jgi:hypothetical protein
MRASKARPARQKPRQTEAVTEGVFITFVTRHPVWTAASVFALAALVFYWIPLTSPHATPHWDTIDQHYSVQKFAAEELKAFRLPQWTEFSFAGFPFLADPQVGIWYPLNWPFFLAGIEPKSLQGEIAFHIFLACLGAWLLARLWLGNVWQAAIAAVTYGFSGYVAGHASHLGILQTAAWLPLLLYGMHVSIRSLRAGTIALTAVGCACMFLAGHFQTALYSFAAIGVYAMAVAALEKRWLAAIRVLGACAVLSVLLTSIQWLPTMELAAQTERADRSFAARLATAGESNAPLIPRALWTLVVPDTYGSVSGYYSGPMDRTQYYFYGGFLLLPLAVIGVISSRFRWAALALVVPFAWYAFGPNAGLYKLVANLPGFNAVRAPVHAWFVVALGLSLLAAIGAGVVRDRTKLRWLAFGIALVTFCDVLYWNSLANRLAYSRVSFQALYGDAQNRFAHAISSFALPPGQRLHSPFSLPGFGPANHAYELRVPVTYGYNPLAIARYREYYAAANANPNLLNAMAVGFQQTPTGHLVRNTAALPKFFFPKRLTAVPAGGALAMLGSANPIENALVEGQLGDLLQDEAAAAVVRMASMERYVVETRAQSPSLLRTAIPWFPAWRAKVNGRDHEIRIVDHAMIGIPVPAGVQEVVLEYRSDKFRIGAALSLFAAVALAGTFLLRRRLTGRHHSLIGGGDKWNQELH